VSEAEVVRAGCLYLPVMAALLAGVLGGRRPRVFAGTLLSLLWACGSLLILQRLNATAEWWTFATDGPVFRGMPLELYLGWVVLWGAVPQLALRRLGLDWSVAAMVAFDVVAMPLCGPVVRLGPRWLVGEAVAAALVLAPAQGLAHWTTARTHLRARAALQVATAGVLFLYAVPELVFALRPGRGWDVLLTMPAWQRQLDLQAMLLLALPGVAAVVEFAERGDGTPIPYDPPQRLVGCGIYRYCANPMQMSCAAVMLLWVAMLRSGWMAVAAGLSVVYSAGIAEWDEAADLKARFGAPWVAYRGAVRAWRLRWRPYASADAEVYIARTCGQCSEVRRWLEARHPVGLRICDAETLPQGSIRRMRYVAEDGSSDNGVRAMGRALEHLNFAWAMTGAALRLPGVWWMVQVVMDAAGLGPREIQGSFE
jgi:protein-S-isoprenylcysteine O-methyltransferase Ste14